MTNSKKSALAKRGLRILTVRGQRVVLDADLAAMYGVETRTLNQAVKRNQEKFPEDFVFFLTRQEVTDLKSQSVTSSSRGIRSQSVTGSGHGGRRKLPLVFTEHGAVMAAMVLTSPKAVEMSVFVVRAFMKMREQLTATAVLAARLAEVEKNLLVHDAALRDIYDKIKPLLLPPKPPKKEKLGFQPREKRAVYASGKSK